MQPMNIDTTQSILSREDLAPHFTQLQETTIWSVDELITFINQRAVLDMRIQEDYARRSINARRFTDDKKILAELDKFHEQIEPDIKKADNILNTKIIKSWFIGQLPDSYQHYGKQLQRSADTFHTENIDIETTIERLGNEYMAGQGKQTIEHNNKTLTMQQAATYLEQNDRTIRKTVFDKIVDVRKQHAERSDQLFDEMMQHRQTIANNLWFDNFRDVKYHRTRIAYTADNAKQLHESIAQHCTPLLIQLHDKKAKVAWIETLTPYDLSFDEYGRNPLPKATSADDIINKTIHCLNQVDGSFGTIIEDMRQKDNLDLGSRKGKWPGWFMCNLPVSQSAFIFSNGDFTFRDLQTMLHEAGHAIHSYLLFESVPNFYMTNYDYEVAEVSSMSMELMGMSWFDKFLTPEQEKQAHHKTRVDIIEALCRIGLVDSFQHRMYENHQATIQDRKDQRILLHKKFFGESIDYQWYEDYLSISRHKQLHIFVDPFYYIEYAIAQLGALWIYKNYLTNKEKATQQYKAFMKLGNTKPMNEIFQTGWIPFDFSWTYVNELMQFVQNQINTLEK